METPLLPHFAWTPESRQPCPYVPTNGWGALVACCLSLPLSYLPPCYPGLSCDQEHGEVWGP